MNVSEKIALQGATSLSPIGDTIQPISYETWLMKYQYKVLSDESDETAANYEVVDQTIEDTWVRVATALAEAEPSQKEYWAEQFYWALSNFMFSPGGRILSSAGVARRTTMFNCFVMGDIPDDMGGIFDSLKEAALTMQQGGGIGYDFSTIRPKGSPVRGVGADASGPLSFMDVWNEMCKTIMSAGSRRGAMMAVLSDDHPDIEQFIEAKRTPGRLTNFNLSVLVSDAFISAIKNDTEWKLQFNGKVYKTMPARELWDKIMKSTYSYAEPGVIFIDRINKKNNLWYTENIRCTNPCGEMPLAPYSLCLLGSINFARLIQNAFEPDARMDEEKLAKLTRVAVRMLDNVIDVSNYPLPQHEKESVAKRLIGLGVTGLADAFIMVGAVYGSPRAVTLTDRWMSIIRREAYMASIDLAKQKGSFPLYDAEKFLAGENIQSLDPDVQNAIAKHGIRNGRITSIAPTGTISFIADNASGGIEPVFDYKYSRNVRQADGRTKKVTVMDYAYRVFRQKFGESAELTPAFVSAQTLSPAAHLVIQATTQRYVDNSISKTINLPESIAFEDFKEVYMMAFDSGCKGTTTYRPNDVTGSILIAETKPEVRKEVAVAPAPMVENNQFLRARPDELPGTTHKMKLANMSDAMYITITDLPIDGKLRPHEIFIHSKNMEHFAWVTALTRMISAVFRRGGDVTFVAEELKAVFDPRGGSWWNGRYVPSTVAGIGEIIERHLLNTGVLSPAEAFEAAMLEAAASNPEASTIPKGAACPKCSAPALQKHEGCEECLNCNYQKCSG